MGRLESRVVFTLDYNEYRYAAPWAMRSILGDDHSFFGSSITSMLGKTFRKDRVKRKQKEQLLILLFVNLLLHLCCL